jgi:DtxR family Mn-dependent transcriptional regulator
MEKQEREEALELVGTLEEKGDVFLKDLQASHLNHPLNGEQIDLLQKEKMILVDSAGRIQTTPEGKMLARQIIRRHRLAERLITDVLILKDMEKIEESACDLEHVMSPELTDRICTLLGHPSTCPHGKRIPAGICCTEKRTKIESLIYPLDKLDPGSEGVIAYISTRDHYRLDQLTSMGLFPGTRVKVHQKQPALVILYEETTLAIDPEIAKEIHVWGK